MLKIMDMYIEASNGRCPDMFIASTEHKVVDVKPEQQ